MTMRGGEDRSTRKSFHGDGITVEIGRVGTLRVSVGARVAARCPTRGANAGPVPPAELTPVQAR